VAAGVGTPRYRRRRVKYFKKFKGVGLWVKNGPDKQSLWLGVTCAPSSAPVKVSLRYITPTLASSRFRDAADDRMDETASGFGSNDDCYSDCRIAGRGAIGAPI
jgi:hypothetical protein